MMKNVFKRGLASVLALVMILAMVPVGIIGVSAASGTLTTNVEGLTATYNGTSGTAAGNSIDLTAQGKKVFLSIYSSTTTSLTLTNSSGETRTLSFDYVNSGANRVQINNTDVGESGNISVELAANGECKITLKSQSSAAIASMSLTNIKLAASGEINTTFTPATNGTYTVDGSEIVADTTLKKLSTDTYAVVATPASGYQFLGWFNVDTNECVGTAVTMNLQITANQKITARFVSANSAIFETAGQRFADLNDAVNCAIAQSAVKITLVGSGVVPAGNYEIPSGITLLIPFDDAGTMYTTEPEYTKNQYTSPSVYKYMDMATGAHITVKGAISVSAKIASAGGGNKYGAAPTGTYGQIKMQTGSSIDVESGANLYCWGFITGAGEVEIKSGAKVYECFQIADFRGGSASGEMNGGGKVFIFSQYYVQNVEVAMTIHAGAEEIVYAALYASYTALGLPVTFIGEKGMFNLTSGTLTKSYDPSTDRLTIDLEGEATVQGIVVSVGFTSYDSSDFYLPITNNMTINVKSGVASISQDVELLPGAKITVAQEAGLLLMEGADVIVYDSSDWVNKSFVHGNDGNIVPVVYTPTRTYNRTASDLVDVVIDINGTVIAIGNVYTSAGGAAIISSEGTGVINFYSAAGTQTTIQQFANNSTFVDIAIVSAKLKNADGSYTETAGAEAGTEYVYQNGKWQIPGAAHECADNDNDHLCDECGEKISDCADGNNDHNCDVCGAKLSDCTDAGKDHVCDICGENVGVHEQAAGKHTCDYCGATMSSCSGGTADCQNKAVCTVCGQEYGGKDPTNHASDKLIYESVGDGDNHRVKYECCGEDKSEEKCSGGTATCLKRAECQYCHGEYGNVLDHEYTGEVKANGNGTHSFKCVNGCEAYGAQTDCTDGDDHNCDICDAKLSECADNDDDHNCDICGEKLSECSDETGDGDHNCDICDKENITSCVAGANSHNCAECDAKLSECADNDDDHNCDICGATMGEHIAAEGSHICAYCGKSVSDCVDNDTDHECDICGATMGEHVAAEGSHNCAYCGKSASDCVDNDTDHECDICGATMGEHIQAEGKHTCDYCNQTMSECSDVTGDGDHNCDICGAENITNCAGGTATCQKKAVCADCGEEYGELNMTNHVSTELRYESVEGKQHNVSHACCGTLKETVGCEDTDDDHKCDLCEAVISEHKGGEASCIAKAICEVCGELYGEVNENNHISDLDNNHLCEGCGEKVSDCKDEDPEDHFCDICGEKLSECSDVTGDGDHNCDICDEKNITSCVAGANSHNCAECNMKLTDCVDENKNHECDICGATMGEHADATGDSDHLCDYCGETIGTHNYIPTLVLPTPATKGYYSHDCECGVSYEEELKAGLFVNGNDTYFVTEDGKAETGLVRVVNGGHVHYYYFDLKTGKAYKASDNEAELFEIVKTNGYELKDLSNLVLNANGNYGFPAGQRFYINSDGTLVHDEDTSKNGFYTEADGKIVNYVDGVVVYLGLVKIGEDFYYVRSNGELAVNRSYYVSRNNDILDSKTRSFDAEGKMIKDGFVEINGALYYFENNTKIKSGLIEIEGEFYYARTSTGEIVRSRTYWVTKTNGLAEAGNYEFDAEGKMVTPRNGIVEEDGKLYYYVNNKKTYAGLIEIDGSYYYVRSTGQVATGKYWVTKTNGLVESGSYEFDDDGKMITE